MSTDNETKAPSFLVLLALVVAFGVGFVLGDQAGVLVEHERFQKEAVVAKVGKWGAGEKGEPVFQWSVCTALGVRQ